VFLFSILRLGFLKISLVKFGGWSGLLQGRGIDKSIFILIISKANTIA